MPVSTAPEPLIRKTKSLAHLFAKRVADTPDREAYRYPVDDLWRSMTWRQAGERVTAIAAGLLALGLKREERVGILANTRLEWLLADLSLSAIAVERRPDRAARILRNAAAFGVSNLGVIEGSAPRALEGLAAPNAVFIGGGTTTPGMIEAVQNALRPAGRLVVNAVSLQTEAVLLACQSQWGGALTRIEISRASPISGEDARMTGWRTAMPVTQWVWVKR